MKIEIKNTDFKYLVEFMQSYCCDVDPGLLDQIWHETLKPQYDKAFLKYQDEKQEFKHGEIVKFKTTGQTWKDAQSGVIHKIFKKANGQYKYMIKYTVKEMVYEEDYETGEYFEKEEIDVERYTNPLTKKNIKSN